MRTAMRCRVGVVLAVGTVAVAGCAPKRHPSAVRLETAEVAIREAEVSGAAQYAPLDLRLAREKLDRARRALDDDDGDRAHRLSEEALADAQLAEAKTNSEKARYNADEMRKDIEALRSDANPPRDDR